MGVKPNTLVEVIDMVTRFDENFGHDYEVRRKRNC